MYNGPRLICDAAGIVVRREIYGSQSGLKWCVVVVINSKISVLYLAIPIMYVSEAHHAVSGG